MSDNGVTEFLLKNIHKRLEFFNKEPVVFKEILKHKNGKDEDRTPPCFIDGKVYLFHKHAFRVYDVKSGKRVNKIQLDNECAPDIMCSTVHKKIVLYYELTYELVVIDTETLVFKKFKDIFISDEFTGYRRLCDIYVVNRKNQMVQFLSIDKKDHCRVSIRIVSLENGKCTDCHIPKEDNMRSCMIVSLIRQNSRGDYLVGYHVKNIAVYNEQFEYMFEIHTFSGLLVHDVISILTVDPLDNIYICFTATAKNFMHIYSPDGQYINCKTGVAGLWEMGYMDNRLFMRRKDGRVFMSNELFDPKYTSPE